MDSLEQNLGYEKKMDQVSVQIEELVLDAMLSAFEKIRKRNLVYISPLNRKQDDIKFYPRGLKSNGTKTHAKEFRSALLAA